MEDLTKNSSKILKGISWSSLLSFLTYSLAIIKIFILARLIFPEDFGIMALSLLFVNIIKQFSNLGLEQAFIQDDKYNRIVDKITIKKAKKITKKYKSKNNKKTKKKK